MEQLIKEYIGKIKKEIIEEDSLVGLKERVLEDIENYKISIPVQEVQEMLRKCKKNNQEFKLLAKLFNHITKPSKEWPQATIGKKINGKTMWYNGGVDEEFRDYLVAVEKYINEISK